METPQEEGQTEQTQLDASVDQAQEAQTTPAADAAPTDATPTVDGGEDASKESQYPQQSQQ